MGIRGGYPAATIMGWTLAAVWQLDLSAWAIPLLFVTAFIGTTYANVLNFFVLERAFRPVVDELAAHLSDDTDVQSVILPLRRRLLAAVPALNVITGVLVVGLAVGGGGADRLAGPVFVSIAVALTFAFGITFLLAASVTAPIDRLQSATARVAAGDLGTRVPVAASDEVGNLTRGFNRMVAGLQERERLREAFGTFVDPDLAERVAREGTDLRGEEVDLSIVFMDVRGFTTFAEHASATDVVARLNSLYDVVVPVILRHGGHANKFIGDGLLAVFGAPERQADHADRALAAACDIAASVKERFGGDLSVGLGVNSGPAVVGTVGGGGRLDFTVIGDTVNTASRVESATRHTGDDILITQATRERLTRPADDLEGRPAIPLKGKTEQIRLYAPGKPVRSAHQTG